MPEPQNDNEHVIDLESSVADEMERVIGCDADAQWIDPQTESINEPHHRRTGSSERELLKNQFPEEQTEA